MAKLFQYGGSDLLGIMFSFLMLYFLGNHKRYGFLCGAVANTCWMVFGVITQSYPLILANVVFCGLNLRGYMRWNYRQSLVPGAEKAVLEDDLAD